MKTIHFPRWAEVLSEADLGSKQQESFKVTIRWYLSWCHKCGLGCSVQSAKDFVSWAQKEKNASDWVVERWKEAIRWFFLASKQGDGGETPHVVEPLARREAVKATDVYAGGGGEWGDEN